MTPLDSVAPPVAASDSDIDAPVPALQYLRRNWYRIEALVYDNQRVVLVGTAGYEMTGWRRRFVNVVRWYGLTPSGDTVELRGKTRPTLWRPIDETAWRWPLPEPATISTEQVWAKPQVRADTPLQPPANATQQWRQVEADLLQAWRIDRLVPDRERAQLKVKVLWPPTSAAPGDYPTGITLGRNATAAEMTLWERMMGLVGRALLGADENRVVRLRANGYYWRSIGEQMRIGESEAKRVYRDAVRKVEAAASW